MKKYQLVTKSGTFYPTITDLEFSNAYLGEYKNPRTRDELQGCPRLKGYCGPMYNGKDSEGNTIIRYETSEVYSLLSKD